MLVSFSSLVSYDYICDPTNGTLITEVKAGRMVETSCEKHRERGQRLSHFPIIHSTITKYLLGGRCCVGAKRKLREISSVPSRDVPVVGTVVNNTNSQFFNEEVQLLQKHWGGMTNSACWESWEGLTEEVMLD